MKNYASVKKELKRFGIIDVKAYKFYRWHSGFQYFIGIREGTKVFIKVCCGLYDTVSTESFMKKFDNVGYYPQVICFDLGKYHWVATEFIECTPISDINYNIISISELIEQAVEILDWLNNNGILHRDLRPENICLTKDNNVIVIDFGWAIYKDMMYAKTNYPLIEEILNTKYRNADGSFDDALSVYLSIKEIMPGVSEDDLKPIKDLIGRFSV